MEHIDVAVTGGGQSGLATAHALMQHGLRPVVVEASGRAAGAWPHYYDSLTLFSPARYSSVPGMPSPSADRDRYPHRDEVVAYLAAYAGCLDTEIRTGCRVTATRRVGDGLAVELAGGCRLSRAGRRGRPPGRSDTRTDPRCRAFWSSPARCCTPPTTRSPAPFSGRRVVVVGNSAVQIAAELARTARVTLATRGPVKFAAQRILGRDLHFWAARTGLDAAPLGRLLSHPPAQPVLDDGRYRAALAAGRPDRRPLFTGADGTKLLWSDGRREEADAIVLATGYRPHRPCLSGLDGLPALVRHVST
ncbi:FAD-dependent oxidoreductase [[Kitasatospora] papulosa]|uniref:FAD-dependent oxidoreductase n=1 Tax=[Kitasatospora] papulosa TaxID=1464011 RepID=UPI0036ADEE10